MSPINKSHKVGLKLCARFLDHEHKFQLWELQSKIIRYGGLENAMQHSRTVTFGTMQSIVAGNCFSILQNVEDSNVFPVPHGGEIDF